jgi:hypothetical protein
MILGAVGAAALTIGLGVGATLDASGDSTPPTPTGSTITMDAMGDTHMNGDAAMSSMMNGSGMTSMMGADGMAAMHTAMHEALGDSVPADVLAACDELHVSMTSASASSSTDAASDHAAHHAGDQP